MISDFCFTCLHCHVNDQRVVPRPLDLAVHGNKPNKALHFDFTSIQSLYSKTKHNFQYVLILKDDFSGFVQLVPATDPKYNVVGEGLVDWYKRFVIPETLVSDQGSHFTNKLWKNSTESFKQKITLSLHTHIGVMEQLKLSPVILNLERDRWSQIFECKQKNALYSFQLYMYIESHKIDSSRWTHPNHTCDWTPLKDTAKFCTSPHNKLNQYISSLYLWHSYALFWIVICPRQNTQKRVGKSVDKTRLKEKAFSLQTILPKFSYWRLCPSGSNFQGKLPNFMPRWTGTYRITRVIKDLDYEDEVLVATKKFDIHSSRLHFYSDEKWMTRFL